MNPVRHGPLGDICGFRDHAVKAVGRRKRGRRPAAAPDFRKAVCAGAEGVGAACVEGYPYRRLAAPVVRSGGLGWVA
jgi:hypothetical protein